MIARRDPAREAAMAGRQGSKASYWLRRMNSTSSRNSYIFFTTFRYSASFTSRGFLLILKENKDNF